MVDARSELGPFLKGRRAALSPSELGLPEGTNRRRVRGLRREEVAQLAGVSVDYYTRIEQGRATAVSAEILDAVAGALRLDADERRYLHNVAARPTGGSAGEGGVCTPPPVPRQRVRPQVRALLDGLGATPALVLGRGLDVLAWNRALGLLWPLLEEVPEDRLNLALMMFLEPAAGRLHADQEAVREQLVAGLRAASGRTPDEPRLCAVLLELRRLSPRFRELWEARAVAEKRTGRHRLRHPAVGELELGYEKLILPATGGGDEGQELMVYVAEPGSPSEAALRVVVGDGALV
ncbi:helix-turn-helix transcriptional regulator [Streptomyces sp. RY43-2]|uniref:Helix-turn-helix transcriptional regulator n=1 Tax=Streptomyces macrolidinus TaxID=2952607 RepID=A0ABT0ZCQ8_9ACTN|nr:helix-turn-helix transcriptional regulator [Streptomyces macrolidinus]MCN9241201.1 helix-turn-helix transcriptional regulator [Streptomyces macrolidinus]